MRNFILENFVYKKLFIFNNFRRYKYSSVENYLLIVNIWRKKLDNYFWKYKKILYNKN